MFPALVVLEHGHAVVCRITAGNVAVGFVPEVYDDNWTSDYGYCFDYLSVDNYIRVRNPNVS